MPLAWFAELEPGQYRVMLTVSGEMVVAAEPINASAGEGGPCRACRAIDGRALHGVADGKYSAQLFLPPPPASRR